MHPKAKKANKGMKFKRLNPYTVAENGKDI